ncbi:hypothetical protein LguiB_030221 [Lonicera macranthoides]
MAKANTSTARFRGFRLLLLLGLDDCREPFDLIFMGKEARVMKRIRDFGG